MSGVADIHTEVALDEPHPDVIPRAETRVADVCRAHSGIDVA